ncbi:polymorphic toxin type 44 domain-containing protein [Pseudomonas lijiangensis]|uniref:PAAR domain-containing protein n=1 Tax=Pseudomonas lijiangensis TaxID=2995658 RepID=A0ABX8HWY5_9PSED|nr:MULTISPECIES: polymorphic toxin type 44 domain-containing protein [Pseudomonas syringae group]MBX8499087.1 PAAR domain-containing protein [Pseudomonas lijiangensis]MBX8504043.1 PAAR domain-containing protein [Pseudomonas lijiangensis]MBX8563305.1 PAAR domain-containing protein [Pseudomonas cichorii]QWU84453.1 PAAR domain-containing protein [Pseudomonas lijiangensis]
MTPSARLGDKHVCPMPGHGTTPIVSASGDVNIDFMGSARVGDTCGCGAVITSGFPSILVNGRPMAHLGSPTSHGGTIITGSGDVGGGFVMGDAGGATVINFMALGAFRPDGTVDDEKMATLLADPKLKEKAVAAKALGDPKVAPKQPESTPEPKAPATCKDPDMMEQVASYIAGEMNRNITHPSVLRMKKLTSFDAAAENEKFQKLPWYARLSRPDFEAMELGNTVSAMALWAERVGQNRPWDHKVTIGQQFGGPWQKQGQVDYFYDIWSNIHYGYVGRAGGFSESILLDGAGLEQIASDSIRKVQKWGERKGPHRSADIEGMRAWDDIGDRVSISIGVKLYKQHPNGGITAKMLMDEVLALPRSSWGDGTRDHVCK